MSDGEMRIGTEEREAAKRLLKAHFDAGRLDSDEYEDRRGRAGDAVTRADLDALFDDLPPAAEPATDVSVPAAPGSPPARQRRAVRDTIMALLPFAALLLFFRTGEWLWFLLIPVGAILLYGPHGRPEK